MSFVMYSALPDLQKAKKAARTCLNFDFTQKKSLGPNILRRFALYFDLIFQLLTTLRVFRALADFQKTNKATRTCLNFDFTTKCQTSLENFHYISAVFFQTFEHFEGFVRLIKGHR